MKKLYGVIGDPIGHSMSPLMHNDAFHVLGLEAYYHPFHVKPQELEAAVKGMKAIGVQGFNITIPHKSTIIPFLDEIDPLAKAIGAVNTVVLEEGKWVGYNTDGEGYVRALREEYKGNIKDKEILIIGAGGAARAIYFTLASQGIKSIHLCNRTVERAKELADNCPYNATTSSLSLKEAEENLRRYDIIIQTSSIGMSPKTEETPLSVGFIKGGAFVSDIIYNPLETKFLREAKEKGATVQNGIKMFIYQGALAFEKWTGIFPDTERMEDIVIKQLGGQYVNR
ncbi:MAG TPA: shikimate dehydrogenase [Chondromyces sp.]|nr:shikimate dehydrogenase [Chondromyces sp.]